MFRESTSGGELSRGKFSIESYHLKTRTMVVYDLSRE